MNSRQEGIIDFGGSIYGFEDFQYFKVEEIDAESQFSMLSSLEHPEVGFVVMSPFDINREYRFQLNDEMIESLKAKQPEDLVVMVIVTVRTPFDTSTINMLAPLVVNMQNGIGRQIVLSSDDEYSIHTPLFSNGSEGESPCSS